MRRYAVAVTGTPPITVGDLISWLKLPTGFVDASLPLLVAAAITAVEDKIRSTIVQATVTLSLDLVDVPALPNLWWDGVREGPISMFTPPQIELGKGPTQSVTSITSYDLADVGSVYDAANYRLDNVDKKQQARVVLNIGAVWPSNLRLDNALEIVTVNGYANGSVPSQMVQAMLMVAAWGYMHRAPCSASACDACGATAVLGSLMRINPSMGRPRRTPQRASPFYGSFGGM